MSNQTNSISTFLYRLTTPKLTVALAAATTSANSTFNTNIPFGLAMNIRRIRSLTWMADTPQTAATQVLATPQLTEANKATVADISDPLSLWDSVTDFRSDTAVGFVQDKLFETIDFLP